MDASSTQFKTMTETEVLRRQNNLLMKICAAIAIISIICTTAVVYVLQDHNVKVTRSAVNAVVRGVKQCLPSGS